MTTKHKIFNNTVLLILFAAAIGLLSGYSGNETMLAIADGVAEIFVRFLKLVSIPLVFLSVTSTLTSLDSWSEVQSLGTKVIRYTLLTTLIAAGIALLMFLIFNPKISYAVTGDAAIPNIVKTTSYKDILFNMLPKNFVGTFLDNNVMGIMILAFFLGFATLSIPKEQKKFLNKLFSSLFATAIKITEKILFFMPLAVWAFVTQFVGDSSNADAATQLMWYVLAVLGANVVQATVVLPVLLRLKGYSPAEVFRGYLPALTVAFFSKSSNVALPTTLKCAQDNLGISKKVSNFSLPLCSTCNMNACAGFILITVMFVGQSNGLSFSPGEMLMWVFLATFAAIGNAGVPMGCYFLSCAFIAAMDLPLTIMGLILPVYGFIDMVETAVNIWSDGVITAVVDGEVSNEQLAESSKAA